MPDIAYIELLLSIENQSYCGVFHNRAFYSDVDNIVVQSTLRAARYTQHCDVAKIGEKCAIIEIAAIALIF